MRKILPSVLLACLGLVIKSAASPVLVQNFETGMAPWTVATTGGGAGWTITSGVTTTQLGVYSAHTHYAVVNEGILSSTTYNNPTAMKSPVFSLVGTTTPYLSFDWDYFQAYLSASPYTHELAWIDISTDGGTTFSLLDSIAYSPGGTWSTKFISLATYSSAATCVLRFNYTDQGGKIIGIAVDNIMVYDAAQTDLSFTSVTPAAGTAADYFTVGSSVTFSGTVTNYGAAPISSFVASYQVGTGAVVNNTISTSVPAMSTATFSYTTPYTMPAASQYPVSLWVTATGDDYLNNDSMATSVQGVNFLPTKRVLFEEGTGTWCGYCVRGIIYMDSLWKLYPNGVSIVSVHDYGGYDAMAEENSSTEAYDNLVSSKISGYPSMIIDRTYTDDPSGALTDYVADSSEFGFANMSITATDTGGNVKATVTVVPALNLSGNYNLEFVIEEDSVTGTAAGYAQHDYYGNVVVDGISNGAHSIPLYGCGYNFNDSTTVITAGHIKFPFVARWTIPNDLNTTPNGIAGSLPSTMTSGTTYTYSTSAAIATGWIPSNIRVVAFMIDDNPTDPNYGQVLNSVNLSFTPPNRTSVNNVNTAVTEMRVFPNPANDLAHVQFELNTASNVQFSVYDAVGHEVFSHSSEQMNAGGQQINFSTADLTSGIYNVVVRTENGQLSQRLSIVK